MTTAGKFASVLKRSFVSGVLVVVPLILTYIVLRFMFKSVDGVLSPLLEHVLGYYIPGLGIITTLCLIILAGVLTRNFLGAQLYRLGERLLGRMPVIRPVYSAAKQLLEAVALPSTSSFKEVIIIEYPRRGAYAIGFVTGRMEMILNGETRQFVAVFVPSTPTPISGFVLLVPADEAIKVDMTVEEGVKFLVSGGVSSPDRVAELMTEKRVLSK